MEYDLRSHCTKLKVIGAKSLSGAHLMLTKEAIAIRTYYPYDLEQIKSKQSEVEDDFDGVSKFLKSFKKALVIFIIQPNDPVFHQQLDDTHSYFHRAQRIVGQHTMDYPDKTLQVKLFADTKAAVQGLTQFADLFTSKKTEKRNNFILQYRDKLLVSLPARDQEHHKKLEAIARERAQNALRGLARRANFPPNEENVLMRHLGSLESIAKCNRFGLDQVPIESRSKDLLVRFFGASGPPEPFNDNASRMSSVKEFAPPRPPPPSSPPGHFRPIQDPLFDEGLRGPLDEVPFDGDLGAPIEETPFEEDLGAPTVSDSVMMEGMEYDWMSAPKPPPPMQQQHPVVQTPVNHQRDPTERVYQAWTGEIPDNDPAVPPILQPQQGEERLDAFRSLVQQQQQRYRAQLLTRPKAVEALIPPKHVEDRIQLKAEEEMEQELQAAGAALVVFRIVEDPLPLVNL
ncbi:MAG: hypothetical protein SGILL_006048, partial [Bacillariaceae sp.]